MNLATVKNKAQLKDGNCIVIAIYDGSIRKHYSGVYDSSKDVVNHIVPHGFNIIGYLQ